MRHAVAERALGLEGVHVHRAGQQPVSFRWISDERRDVYSVSKTFTSVAVGLARAEGLVDLDDRVLTHLPQFAASAAAGVEELTIRHLLMMTAGIRLRWDYPETEPGDPAQNFLAIAPITPPGTAYAYRGSNSYLLGRIIAAVSGSDLRDFLVPRLFDPLGIPNPQWFRCPLGFPLGAMGLFLRTEEIARLGETLLHGGEFRGRQVIPADYVELMYRERTPTDWPGPDNAVYGLHWWPCARDDAWRMDGLYGQFSIVFPRQRACVTVTAHYEKPTTDILDAIWAELVPYL